MTSNLSPVDSSSHGMSLREKSAWIYLLTTLAVYVPYFAHIGRLLVQQRFGAVSFFVAFVSAVFAQSLLTIAGYFLFAHRQRNEPKDERDAAMEARSFRYGYGALIVSTFSLMITVSIFFFMPVDSLGDRRFTALLIAQAILLCAVLAETTRYATLALGYRRGI